MYLCLVNTNLDDSGEVNNFRNGESDNSQNNNPSNNENNSVANIADYTRLSTSMGQSGYHEIAKE